MIIFIDFDNTLFDSSSYKQKMFGSLGEVGFSGNVIKKNYEKIVFTGYSHLKFISTLRQEHDFDATQAIQCLDNITDNVSQFLYADAIWFLEKYSKAAKLILLSWGDIEYQKRKIKNSDISDYFDEIIVTDRKKYLQLYEYSKLNTTKYFINDNPYENREVTWEMPELKVLNIRRENARQYFDSDYHDMKSFKDLKQISNYIDNLTK